MNLLEQTKYLIKKTGFRPDKLKGQNFCVDENVLFLMVQTAELKPGDAVVEVGPGFGFLTQQLVGRVKKLIAVELDKVLFANLKNLSQINKNLEIINQNILNFNPDDYGLVDHQYKIVANLPYGISSVFLKKFLTGRCQPWSLTLLLQKEVAERICAPAGQLSLLGLSVQLYARPSIAEIIKPSAFWPMPRVNSAIIQIKSVRHFPYSDKIEEKKYWQIIRSGFCAKRKTLENNLASSLHLPKAEVNQKLSKVGIKDSLRPQELSLDDWLAVVSQFG